jgi:hypothetical protein
LLRYLILSRHGFFFTVQFYVKLWIIQNQYLLSWMDSSYSRNLDMVTVRFCWSWWNICELGIFLLTRIKGLTTQNDLLKKINIF